MTDGNPKPAPLDEGTGVVVEDGLGKRFDDHDTSDADDAQQIVDSEILADRDQEPEDAEPAAPRAPRRVAPKLDRDLLTYRDDRYVPLFAALHDGGHPVTVIRRSLGPFVVRSNRSTVVLVEDDVDSVDGASNFDLASIRACARRCVGAVILHGERHPASYRAAVAMMACPRRHVLLIDTRPERRRTWVEILKTITPRLPIVVQATREFGATE